MKRRRKRKIEPPTPKPSIQEYRKQQRAEWRNREHSTSLFAYSGGLPSLGKRR